MRAGIVCAIVCASAFDVGAIPMASQEWTRNRLNEAKAEVEAEVKSEIYSNVYDKAQTDARIIEIAPISGLATKEELQTASEGLSNMIEAETVRIDGLSDAIDGTRAQIPTNNAQLANGAKYVTESITNGLVTASVTNGLVTASITNGLAGASITNGLATSSVTNGLIAASYIATNNPAFVAAVTNCPVVIAEADAEALTEWGIYGVGGTIGTLLTALFAAMALIRKKKAEADSLADEFDATKGYAKDEYVTYNGKLYRFNAAHAAGAWTGTDVDDIQVTAPDATVDVGSDNRLRVVDAEANILWSQGYQLADESASTLSCDKVNLISLTEGTTTLSLTLPTVPTGVTGDFIVDIDNSQNTSDVACEIADLTAMKISVVLMDGDDLNDLLTFTANTMYELYFTQTAFAIDGKPTWKVMRQVVVSGNPSTGS